MTPIEEQLRQLFSAQSEPVPALDDIAGRAIRRARARRRVRTVGSGLAALLLTVMTAGGVVWLRPGWQSDGVSGVAGGPLELPAPASSPARPTASAAGGLTQKVSSSSPGLGLGELGLDLRVSQELWGADGERHRLTGVDLITDVFEVPRGWVYGDAEQVRLLTREGTSLLLAAAVSGWALSQDGTRLAYARNGRMLVYTIGRRGLVDGTGTAVPEDTQPVAFTDRQVLVTSAGGALFGLFTPGKDAAPAWRKDVLAIYGTAGDEAAGLVRADDLACLARIGADNGPQLVVTATDRCYPASAAGTPGALAADGGWLAHQEDGEVRLTEWAGGPTPAPATVRCGADGTATMAWADDSTLLLSDGARAVRCRTDGVVEAVPLPDGVTDRDWAFVPRLGRQTAPSPSPGAEAPAG